MKQQPTPSQIHRLQQALLFDESTDVEATMGDSCCDDMILASFASDTATKQETKRWMPHVTSCIFCKERLQQWQATLHHVEAYHPTASWDDVRSRGEELSQKATTLPFELFEAHRQKPEGSRESTPRIHQLQQWLDTLQPFPTWLSAFAAVLLVVWFAPSLGQDSTHEGIRSKGHKIQHKKVEPPRLEFRFFLRRGPSIRKGQVQMYVKPGDQLRFVFWNAYQKPLYLYLWSTNEKGTTTPLYPLKEEAPFVLPSKDGSIRQVLPGGIVLDDTKVAERFYVCVSKQPLHPSIKSHNQDIFKAPKMSVTCLYQTSWLLQKQ